MNKNDANEMFEETTKKKKNWIETSEKEYAHR